jgi:hypothetical protein
MKHLFLFALLTTPAAFLAAQTDQTIIDRAQQQPTLPRPASGGETGSIAVSAGDADAGNQRIAEPRKLPLKVYATYDAQAYYTDNVNLVPSSQPEDYALIVANTLALRAEFKSWAIGENGLLTPSIGFNFQRFYHGVGSDDHKALDFDSYSVPLSLRYRFGANWEATAGLAGTSIYSLEGPPKYHLIFRSYSPSLSLRKLIAFGDNHILSVGTGMSYAFTKADRDSVPAGFSPYRDDRNDKWDASVDAAYYYLHGKWAISPSARLSYSDYLHYEETSILPFSATQVDRRDLTGSIGLSITYNLTPWASARVFTSYDWRDSQGDAAFDYGYENTNAGLGVTFSASF